METTQGNQASWNANAYQAWLNRFGQPEEAAARIKKTRRSGSENYINMQGFSIIFRRWVLCSTWSPAC